MTRYLAAILLLLSLAGTASGSLTADSKKVAELENIYADVSDAVTVIGAIDSGLFASYRGKDRTAWDKEYHQKRKDLAERLSKLPAKGLSASDAKAVAAMRTQLALFPENISAPFSPNNHCQDARRKDLDYASLRKSLVSWFIEIGGNMSFENGKINRQTALDLLHELPEPERRRAVFTALGPLWSAINGNNEPDSPYRRMIA